jgi:putative oxidoreductase
MKNKILLVISVLFGLMFVNAGLNKFFNYMPVPDDLPQELIQVSVHMMEVGWLMPLVGLVEIIGGLLFMVNKTRAVGAIIILPIMIGILLIHFTVAPSGLPMAIVLVLILVWVMIENREKYLCLLQPHR